MIKTTFEARNVLKLLWRIENRLCFSFLKFDPLYFIIVMRMIASPALYILKVTKSHKIIFIHHQMQLTRRVIYYVQPWRGKKI